MRISRRLSPSLLALALSAVLGCGGSEPTPPALATGTYVLSSVNGAPLPYQFQTRTFLGASLSFLTRSRVEDIRYYKTTSSFGSVTYDTLTSNASYVIDGDRIVITHPSPAGAYADSGTISASGLALQTKHFDLITADSFALAYSHISRR